MGVDFEPHAMHADRVFDVALAVQAVVLSEELHDLTVRRQADNRGGFLHAQAIFRGNLPVGGTDSDDPFGIEAAHVRTVHVNGGPADMHAGNALRLGHGFHDSVGDFVDVNDGAAAHTLVRRLAVADNRRQIAAVRIISADDAANAARADIKSYEMFLVLVIHVAKPRQ